MERRPPIENDIKKSRIKKAFKDRIALRYHKKKDGTVFPANITASLITLNNRKAIQAAIRDITSLEKSKQELLESEKKYRELVNSMNDTVWVIDFDSTILDVNNAASMVLGYTRDELLSMKIPDIDANLKPEQIQDLAGSMPKDKVQVFETYHTAKDGRKLPVEISSSLVSYREKTVILSIARDITERKQVQERLRKSEEKYRGIFEESVAAIYVFDQYKHFIDSNQAGLDLLGYSREELLRLSIPDVDADPIVVLPAHEQLLSGGRFINYEHSLRRKDGSIITVLNNSRPLTDSLGKVVGMQSTLIDITERKQVQERLRESEQRLRAIYETSPDPIGLFDSQGNILLTNHASIIMFGYQSTQEVAGMNARGFFLPEDHERMNMTIREIFKTGSQRNLEFRLLKKDGSLFPAQISCTALYGPDGAPSGIVAITRDISELKRSEEALEKYRDHLEEMIKERTAELEIKSMALQETNTALKVFLKRREDDKKDMEDSFVMNIRTLVLPHVEELKKGHLENRQRSHLDIIETHLNEIASPLLKNMQQYNLTPKETKVAALIKQDKSTKEIAEILKISCASIDVHRKNIRKKFSLTNKSANLSSFLKNLSG